MKIEVEFELEVKIKVERTIGLPDFQTSGLSVFRLKEDRD